jgi:hypothetical protein
MAQTGDRVCSSRSLSGDYGFVAEGVLIGTPGLPPEVQFRSVGVAHFDGKGNLSWVEHTVIDGNSLRAGFVSAAGTYMLNSDCTGSAVVNTPNSPVPLQLSLVLVNEGTELQSVLNSNAIVTRFVKVN